METLIELYKNLNYNLITQNKITIGNNIVYDVDSIEYSHYKNKPAMLTIDFARYTENLNVSEGDVVIWERGYKNDKLYKRFRGFVAEISRDTAICYDELYWIRTQRCKIPQWRGAKYTVVEDGKDVIKYKKEIADKDVLENLLEDIDEINIDNGELGLDFRKPVFKRSLVNGNVNKSNIINALFGKYMFYIDPEGNNFVVEKPYTRERVDLTTFNDKILIEDNTTKPVDKSTQIRYYITSPTQNVEDIIAEYPDGDGFDKVHQMFFNGISLAEATSQARDKYDELNFNGLIGSFTLLGLPYLRTGEVIDVKYKDKVFKSKISSIDETMDSKSIRQIVTLE